MSAEQTAIGRERLTFFLPFENLDDDLLILLSGWIRVERVQEGERILAFDGTDKHQYFLLDGVVELEERNGMRQAIESATDKARTALAAARPCNHNVVALSAVELLRLDGELLALLDNATYTPPEDPQHYRGPGDHIYQSVRQELLGRNFTLPTLPEIAMRIKKAVENESADLAKVARIVNADPAITAKLIKAANSPLYRGADPVETCQAAIVRLGMNTTKQLVVAFTIRDLFKLSDAALRKHMQQTWRHSTEIGAISLVLARMTDYLDPEQALLAGLVHDIGVVPILCQAQKHPELTSNPAALEDLIRELRGTIGALILSTWRFSEPIVQAAGRAYEWDYDAGSKADYCDLVIAAQALSLTKAGKSAAVPPLEKIRACSKLLPAPLTQQAPFRILEQAKDQIGEVMRMLAG